MDQISFEYDNSQTKETVNLRVGAALIDYLLFFFCYVFTIISLGQEVAPHSYHLAGPLSLLPELYWVIYFVGIEKICNGTLGNRIMGLKVISQDNTEVSLLQVIKRRMCDLLDFVWCFGLLGLLLAKHTRNHQRLGDIWAKTIVIRSKQ